MSDLISRKAAIDIADDLRDCISVEGYWAWTERLKKLPSAAEVVRCKDCMMLQFCRFAQGLGLNGFCSQGERREDDNM